MNFPRQFPDVNAAGLVKVTAVNPLVKFQAGRVTVRIVAHPAVEMHRRVQRLRTVADKMPHHAHDIDDIGLGIGDFLRRAAVFLKGFQVAEAGLQFFVIFRDGPRQEPAQLARVVGVPGRINRRKFIRVRRPFPRNVRDEIITHQRQRLRRQAIKLQITYSSARPAPPRRPPPRRDSGRSSWKAASKSPFALPRGPIRARSRPTARTSPIA